MSGAKASWLSRCEPWWAAVAFAPLLLGLDHQIQEVDPSQYAEVGRRMFLSGDWAHLRDNFGPFLNKPPLTFWLMSASFKVLGLTSTAVRLPTLLLGAALLVVTARIGTLLHDRRTGLWGAALLAASPAFWLMPTDPKVDMPLTAFIAISMWLLLEARRRPWTAFLAWPAAALAVLSKGPIGFVAPALAIAPEALRRRWGAAEGEPSGSLWQRIRPFQPVAGVALFAACLLPWYVQNAREWGARGPSTLLWHQSFGRLLERDYFNNTTPAFFLHTVLWAYLPFWPMFAVELVRAARRLLTERTLPPAEARVLWWWFLVPFIAVSLSAYRLPQYCFWVAPPAALISARAMLGGNVPARAMVRMQALIACCALAFGGFLLAVCFPPEQAWKVAAWLIAAAALVGAGLWLGLAAARSGEPALQPMLMGVFAMAAFQVVYQGQVHREILQYQPDEAMGALARTLDPTGSVIPKVGGEDTNALAFYARRDAVAMSPEELKATVAAGRARVAVVESSRLPELEAQGLAYEERFRGGWFGTSRPTRQFLLPQTRPASLRTYVLVTLRPK